MKLDISGSPGTRCQSKEGVRSHTVTAEHRGQACDTAVSPGPPGSQLGAPIPPAWGAAGAPLPGHTCFPAESVRCVPRRRLLSPSGHGCVRHTVAMAVGARPATSKGLQNKGAAFPEEAGTPARPQGDSAARPKREEPRTQAPAGPPGLCGQLN